MASAIHRLHVLGFGLLMTLVCFRSAVVLPDTPDRKLATDTVFEVHVICSEERVGECRSARIPGWSERGRDHQLQRVSQRQVGHRAVL